MGTFMPIAMKCTQEQFEAIKPKLKGLDILLITDFNFSNYLVNKLGNSEKIISNVMFDSKADYNRTVYEEWNEEIFLKACGIEVESLEQQLQKAESEVNRLKAEIENNKPKNGDICVMDNGCYKFITIYDNHDRCGLIVHKINDQELINKLNELIK